MKFAIVLVSCVIAASAFPSLSVEQQFNEFKRGHGKHYASQEEHDYRMKIFEANAKKIEAHNAEAKEGLHTFTMAVNQFADMTDEEFQATLNFRPHSLAGIPVHNSSIPLKNLADGVNWIEQGLVTDVKSQGQCGSCWAFSAAGAMEGAFAKSGKPLESFSPQMLVDCDHKSFGCQGGYMETGFDYAKANGVMKEADYPYLGYQQSSCGFDKSKSVGSVSGYVSIGKTEAALQKALAEVGPISIAIFAGPVQYYSSGILNNCWQGQIDHAVLLVGYGTENGQDYWLIKNSWGNWWGESGYFKLARNSNKQCQISNWASYPTL